MFKLTPMNLQNDCSGYIESNESGRHHAQDQGPIGGEFMPNEMKYGNVSWPDGSSIPGECLATAGEYTGQHKGMVMQDSLTGADNDTYLRARETVRYGTLIPDAGDINFPDILIKVSYTATGAVTENSLDGVTYNAEDSPFRDVPSKSESFTFKDNGTLKTATNTDGTWSVA